MARGTHGGAAFLRVLGGSCPADAGGEGGCGSVPVLSPGRTGLLCGLWVGRKVARSPGDSRAGVRSPPPTDRAGHIPSPPRGAVPSACTCLELEPRGLWWPDGGGRGLHPPVGTRRARVPAAVRGATNTSAMRAVPGLLGGHGLVGAHWGPWGRSSSPCLSAGGGHGGGGVTGGGVTGGGDGGGSSGRAGGGGARWLRHWRRPCRGFLPKSHGSGVSMESGRGGRCQAPLSLPCLLPVHGRGTKAMRPARPALAARAVPRLSWDM